MTRFERPRSLTNLVADHLREEIVTGALDFGAALSEAAIADRLSVSRTPVREAFARLEIEGLVRSEPQRGTFVFTTTAEELTALCYVRVVLETGALRLAACHNAKGLQRNLDAVEKHMAKASAVDDTAAYLKLDTAYHQALIDSAENSYLNQAYQTIAPRMAALRNRLGGHPDLISKSYAEHQLINRHVREGDVAAATKVLIAHIGRKEGSYWSL